MNTKVCEYWGRSESVEGIRAKVDTGIELCKRQANELGIPFCENGIIVHYEEKVIVSGLFGWRRKVVHDVTVEYCIPERYMRLKAFW